ncbi:amidohydrolase [Limnovirga soli]|uniref:Amidohydrolase family protein n=1 Tax=Limnovirga soli TaxID=2656915 RepID=A0A8J8JUS3_9BACT|nr:amidohydrolase [Limnovirga soli]NNV57333.1 amidohydrolase family protein [Limnovirga soli]
MAQLIVYNAQVLTQNTQQPVANAFAVENGSITAIGNADDILPLQQSNTIVVDAKGNTILPGFIDAHIHIWKVGNLKTFLLDLRGVSSIVEMQDRISDFVQQNPGNSWIQARGFNEANMKEGRMPTKEDLDKVVPNRPLWVIRTCAHIGVANSAAIALAGVTNQSAIPVGGEMRLQANGSLNGIFTETALGLITQHIPAYTADDYALMVEAAQNELISYGITAATDPAVMPDLLATYYQMAAAQKLLVRINAMPIRVPDGASEILPVPELYNSEKLQVNTVKFFADGGLSGMTAAMNKPYKNSDSLGVLRLTEDFFYPLAKEAVIKGFGIGTHAIGDRAIEVVLAVYKQLYNEGHRSLRIEHLGLPSVTDLQQMQAMQIHCVSQSIFLKELGKNFAMYLEKERLDRCYPYRSVLDAGVNLALSSDAPVVKDFNPVTGIIAALHRNDIAGNTLGNGEQITLQEAIYAYTLGAAKANGTDHLNGSLETGKKADFIILDKALTGHLAVNETFSVQSTYIDGELVYQQ